MMAVDILIFIGFLLGLVLGSFAGAMSYRWPRDLPWIIEPSRCPVCSARLGVADLVPVLSFIRTKGRCAHCGAPISLRYPIIECVTGMACAGALWMFGATWDGLLVIGLATCASILAASDFETHILPDEAQIALGLLGAVWAWHHNELISGLLAALMGGGLGLGVRYAYFKLRRIEGLGLGDVKLFAIAGLWLGLLRISWYLVIGSILAVVLAIILKKGRQERIPFGVALCIALYFMVLAQGREIGFFP
jgi:leader peptidase (prepilin peptidase)/N-methyltransferase